MSDIPVQPEQLNADWLTSVLRRNEVIGTDNSVTTFESSLIGDVIGLLGMVVRVSLTYDKPVAPGTPDSVVIKFSHPVAENRAIATNLNMYEREVRFFNEIADQVDVPKPVCYFAAMDPETAGNVVVLEDLKRYRAGDQVAGISPDEARMVIDAIVPLHAAYWDSTDTGPLSWMMRIDTSYIEPFMPGVEGSWENCVAQFGECIVDDVRAALPRYIAHLPELHRIMGQRVKTLIHGDVRMDNAMFGDGDPELHPLMLVDWQAIMISNPLQDVAWMLSTCLPVDVRRETENDLLHYYHRQLLGAGVKNYTFDQCVDDYDVAVLYMLSYPLIIGGAFDPANDRGRELAEACLRRSSQTVSDRGVLDRIPS